jgi:hypothetical protein
MTLHIAEGLWLRVAACGLLFAYASVAPLSAQDAATTDTATDATVVLENDGVITPDAQTVLDRVCATFAMVQRYEITAHITRDEVPPFGYKLRARDLNDSAVWSAGRRHGLPV